MKKILSFFIAYLISISYSYGQAAFSIDIYAGSNASWGKNQSLKIDTKGNCTYVLTDVKQGRLDSTAFGISQKEMKELGTVIQRSGFFSLDREYDGGLADGMRITMQITQGNKTHSVQLVNIYKDDVDAILEKLNAILKKKQIRINY